MSKELVIVSGKGGTGKTSITAALAGVLPHPVLADCDVDAANLHLLQSGRIPEEEHEFWCGKKPFIDSDKCTQCGKCLELCRFSAIKPDFSIDKFSCEGCGVCAYFCPAEAIEFQENLAGHWFISRGPYGPLVHAKLGTAEENSGKLVTLVKYKARELAVRKNCSTIIVDGPPGIGCPVIASVSGADLALVVTEATISGTHDLERILDLTSHFRVNTMACINKADINPEMTEIIMEKCHKRGIQVVGRIPYSEVFTKAQLKGCDIIQLAPESQLTRIIRDMAGKIAVALHTEITKECNK